MSWQFDLSKRLYLPWDEEAEWFRPPTSRQAAWDACPSGSWLLWGMGKRVQEETEKVLRVCSSLTGIKVVSKDEMIQLLRDTPREDTLVATEDLPSWWASQARAAHGFVLHGCPERAYRVAYYVTLLGTSREKVAAAVRKAFPEERWGT